MAEPRRLPSGTIAVAATVLAAVLAVGLADALDADLRAQGGQITALAWGRILLLDVYAGLVLFSLWIAWRERRRTVAAAWIVALLALGNLVACIYVLLALRQARGAPARFGSGASDRTADDAVNPG